MSGGSGPGYEGRMRRETDPRAAEGKPEALGGIRVLESTPGHLGGMVAASVLAEFGAEVIKVEPPGGDPARGIAPEGIQREGTGLPFLSEARNRRFVTLATDRPEGGELFRRLSRRADVVIASEPLPRLEQAGIGYRSLSAENPSLIFLALSAYGAFGPDAGRPVQDADILCQALSGAPHIVGEPEGEGPPASHQVPTRLGNWHAGFVQGLWGAFGVLAALAFRAERGRGQLVDVSGAEGLMKFLDYNITWMHTAGRSRSRLGNYDPAVFPYTYLRCRDGHTFLAAYNNEAFATLLEIVGRPELAADPRFDGPASRVRPENEEALQEILEEWSSSRTADEILREIESHTARKSGPAAAVVTGRVNRPRETLRESHWEERGTFARGPGPVEDGWLLAAPPWKMSGTPPRLKSFCRPPGSDNREIFGEIAGLSPGEIARLANAGVI